MIAVTDLDNIDLNLFFFHESIPNTTNPGSYSRIIYSNEYCVFNGVNILFSLSCINQSTYFKSEKYFYDIYDIKNKTQIEKLLLLEKQILDKYNGHFSLDTTKKVEYKLQEKIQNGYIKLIRNTDTPTNSVHFQEATHFLIKISGVWESDSHYGLTFRLFSLGQI